MNENQSDLTQRITQESLQPQRIKKEDKAYQSVLDIEERLQKRDATNIALTGPYGSGKSSILITLKEDFPEHHYLNISLATLKPSDAIINKENEENALPPELVDQAVTALHVLGERMYASYTCAPGGDKSIRHHCRV